MRLKQFKYLLFTEVALIISSTVFAILLFIGKKYYTGIYKDLYQNWKMTPIKKITVEAATESDYSRNKKSDKIEERQKRLGFFPGLTDFSEEFTYDSGDILIWRNYKFTFEFMEKEFSFNNILKNDLKNGKICGVDHLGNNLIFPIDAECPINYIKIIDANDDVNSVSEIENPIELNLGDKKLIYSNKKTNGKILINFEIGTHIPCDNVDLEKSFCLYFGEKCGTKKLCTTETDAAGYDQNEIDQIGIYELLTQNGYEFEEEYESNSDLVNLYYRTWIGLYKKKFETNEIFKGGFEGFFFCFNYGKIKDFVILVLSILTVICLIINFFFIKKTKFYSIYISIVLIILFVMKVFIDLVFVLKGKIFKFEISKRILIYKENNIFYKQFKYVDFIIVECVLDSMALIIEIIFLGLNINDNKLKCNKHCKCCCSKNEQEKKDKLHKILHQNCIRIVKWNKEKIINNNFVEAKFNKKLFLNLLRNAILKGMEIDKIYIDNIIPFDNNRNNLIFLFENEEQNEEIIVFDTSVDDDEEDYIIKSEKTNGKIIINRNDTENAKLNLSYSNSEDENIKNKKNDKKNNNQNLENIVMNLSEEDKEVLEKIKNKLKKIEASKFSNLTEIKNDKINFSIENIFNQIYKVKTKKGIAYMKFLSNLNYLKFKNETQAFNGIKKELQSTKEKIKNLMLLKNEHLCKFIGYSIYKGQVVILIEYIEGENLIDYYKNNVNISLKEKLNIIKQVADAVNYLHCNNFLHNDIRCKNVYIIKNNNEINIDNNNNLNIINNKNDILNHSKNDDVNNSKHQQNEVNDLNTVNQIIEYNNKNDEIKDNNDNNNKINKEENNNSKENNLNNNNNNKYPIVKLCDFGSITSKNEKFIGKISELWASPELIFDNNNSISSDIFCFGSFMYELFNEMPPYFGEETIDILLKIRIMKGYPPNIDKLNCIKELKSIISKCWIFKPQFRPSMENIIEELNDINV